MPIVPALCLAAATTVIAAAGWLARERKFRPARAYAVVLAVVLTAWC